MDKETLAALIDAYADAKASRNKILIKSMIESLEQALSSIFPPEEASAAPEEEGTGEVVIGEY
tara:strand:+ start:721 stop:909 length:189 start_codon:yes stop_codon:yes gene_type:complete